MERSSSVDSLINHINGEDVVINSNQVSVPNHLQDVAI